jgi:hypothetical protein
MADAVQAAYFNKQKEYHVRNDFIGFAHTHVARRLTDVAAQQELGLLSQRWLGLGPCDPHCSAFTRQDLTKSMHATQLNGKKLLCYKA